MTRTTFLLAWPACAGVVLAASLWPVGAAAAHQGAAAAPHSLPWSIRMTAEKHASGTFEVKLTPIGAPSDPVGAMSIAKTFHGDLEATSVGRMLAVGTPVEGSAGYVAMERVTGSLGGRRGSFALQHSGTMTRSTPSLSVTVVPDSGVDGLEGLAGVMDILVAGGRHSYSFRYTLPN